MTIIRSLALAAILFSPMLRAESALKIENAVYAVEYDASAAEFSVLHKRSGKAFAKNGKLHNGTTEAITHNKVRTVSTAVKTGATLPKPPAALPAHYPRRRSILAI